MLRRFSNITFSLKILLYIIAISYLSKISLLKYKWTIFLGVRLMEGGKESVVISVNTWESPGCHCWHRDPRRRQQYPRDLWHSALAGAGPRICHTPNHFYMPRRHRQALALSFTRVQLGSEWVLWCSHFRKVWFWPSEAGRCENIVARSVAIIIIIVDRLHHHKQLSGIGSNCLLLLSVSVYNLYGNCLGR